MARDGVRLLVAAGSAPSHRRFSDLPSILAPGDLLVINTSATLPAAVVAQAAGGGSTLMHYSGWLDESRWIVELRRSDNAGPNLAVVPGDVFALPGGVTLTLLHAHPDSDRARSRLWVAEVAPPTDARAYLSGHGRPIAYRHLARRLPLADHQTVYAAEPGSAEMPSAGRPFTRELLVRLMAAGIAIAPLTLHAGVSSAEADEPPAPEWYSVPASTARLVSQTRRAGGRVVAVGTTVVRALESVATDTDVSAGAGWTDLVLGVSSRVRAVAGVITGLHTPESSHLLLLEAVAGRRLVSDAYDAAVAAGYLWHEFGDSMLFLP